jgi:hypothetical protein
MKGRHPAIDFAAENRTATGTLPGLLQRWLPDGRREGREWVACNPKRGRPTPGSFKVTSSPAASADLPRATRAWCLSSACGLPVRPSRNAAGGPPLAQLLASSYGGQTG